MDSNGLGTETHFSNAHQKAIDAGVDIMNNSWELHLEVGQL